MKGERQLTMLRVKTLEEAEAAEKAGVHMVSIPPELLRPEFRDAAPACFAFPGLEYDEFVTAEDISARPSRRYKRGRGRGLVRGRPADRQAPTR